MGRQKASRRNKPVCVALKTDKRGGRPHVRRQEKKKRHRKVTLCGVIKLDESSAFVRHQTLQESRVNTAVGVFKRHIPYIAFQSTVSQRRMLQYQARQYVYVRYRSVTYRHSAAIYSKTAEERHASTVSMEVSVPRGKRQSSQVSRAEEGQGRGLSGGRRH